MHGRKKRVEPLSKEEQNVLNVKAKTYKSLMDIIQSRRKAKDSSTETFMLTSKASWLHCGCFQYIVLVLCISIIRSTVTTVFSLIINVFSSLSRRQNAQKQPGCYLTMELSTRNSSHATPNVCELVPC